VTALNGVQPATWVAPSGAFAHGLRVTGAGELLFVSGQTPAAPDGSVASDFASQCRQVWANVGAVLEAAGMALEHVVKLTTFLADRVDRAKNSRIRREILGDRPVAVTVVIAGIYDEAWKVEIEVVAAR
jgi:enamine deaminase RidA (YjgF/YER057c/UK114 family)